MPGNIVLRKILNEGYCCYHGYLGLCQARGENLHGMQQFLGVTNLKYHLKQFRLGNRKCQNHPDCMLPIIEEIKKAPEGP